MFGFGGKKAEKLQACVSCKVSKGRHDFERYGGGDVWDPVCRSCRKEAERVLAERNAVAAAQRATRELQRLEADRQAQQAAAVTLAAEQRRQEAEKARVDAEKARLEAEEALHWAKQLRSEFGEIRKRWYDDAVVRRIIGDAKLAPLKKNMRQHYMGEILARSRRETPKGRIDLYSLFNVKVDLSSMFNIHVEFVSVSVPAFHDRGEHPYVYLSIEVKWFLIWPGNERPRPESVDHWSVRVNRTKSGWECETPVRLGKWK